MEIKKENAIVSYKLFDSEMKCKGFQFKEGAEYHTIGGIKVCNKGFHSCINPMDCLDYYPLLDSVFAKVLIWGEIDIEEKNNASKHCSEYILIEKVLTQKEFNIECVEYAKRYSAKNASSGDYAKNASSGYYAQNASSGDYAQNTVTGKNSVDANIGRNSRTKAVIGTWVTLAEYDDKGICIFVSSKKIDGKRLKENVFYTLKNKKFTEVK